MLHLVWRLVPLETPALVRVCPRCAAPGRFRSSDRFRVNAHRRRLDVWLIYRCERCDFTWNLPVVERALPEEIPRERFDAYQRNDRAEAWRCALEAARSERAVDDVPYRVERDALAAPAVVSLAVEAPAFAPRLDRLLARELGLSRSALDRAIDRGEVQVDRDALRRRARDGTTFVVATATAS